MFTFTAPSAGFRRTSIRPATPGTSPSPGTMQVGARRRPAPGSPRG